MGTKIVVVAPNWLGDAVMALPALAGVRAAWPDATLAVAARASVAPLFTMVPGVDEIVRLESAGGVRGAMNWSADADVLRAARADVALLLPNSFRSAWTARGAGIPERWGYAADWRGRLLTRAVERPRGGLHQAEYYLRLVEPLLPGAGAARAGREGAAADAPAAPGLPRLPRLAPPAAALERADRLLADLALPADRRPVIGLAPGAAYGKAKQWPPRLYARLAALLRDRLGATCLVFGAGADGPTGAALESHFRAIPSADGGARAGGPGLVNLVGRTDLPLLVALMTRCRSVVSNDSGAMHVAAAAGVPVTAVFGASDERGTEPLRADAPGAPAHEILTCPAWCRPCMLRECPIDHRCMTGIDPARVADAVGRQVRS